LAKAQPPRDVSTECCSDLILQYSALNWLLLISNLFSQSLQLAIPLHPVIFQSNSLHREEIYQHFLMIQNAIYTRRDCVMQTTVTSHTTTTELVLRKFHLHSLVASP